MSKIEEEYSKRFKGQEWSEGVDAAGIWAAVEQNLTPPKKKFRAIWVLLPLMFVLGGASMWLTMKTKEGTTLSPYGEQLDMKSGSFSNPSAQNNLRDTENIGSNLAPQQKNQNALQRRASVESSTASAIEGSNAEAQTGMNENQDDTKAGSLAAAQPINQPGTINKDNALAPSSNEATVGSDGKGTGVEDSLNDSSGLVDQDTNLGSAQQGLENGNRIMIPESENQAGLWPLIQMERKGLMPCFQTSYKEIAKSPSSFEYAKDLRWEWSVEAGRNVSFLKFKNSPQKNRYEATNSSAFGTDILMNLTHLTKSNWRISTGLGWSQWTTKFKERTVNTEFEVTGIVGFSGDSIAGYTPLYGPVMVEGTQIRNIEHNNKVKSFVIPLTIGKEWHKRRSTFGWNAGMAYHFVLLQGGRGFDLEGIDAFYGDNNRKAFNRSLWAANVDLFYDYALTDQWSLRLSPQVNYVPNQSGSFFQGEVDLWSYGLRVGITRDW